MLLQNKKYNVLNTVKVFLVMKVNKEMLSLQTGMSQFTLNTYFLYLSLYYV